MQTFVIAERLVGGENSGLVKDAEALLDFFRTFVDTCHHGKEESGLFPALEQVGVSRQGGPIGVMLNEHEQGRTHLREMARALKDHEAGRPQSAERFSMHAGEYIDVLKRHIQKEDQVLFPLAAERLPASTAAQLETKFKQIEAEVVGVGKHEQYHTMLDIFMEKYGLGTE
ncbi:MAG: hemerythrin [Desulfobacteraceae bacterium]|nr:MAG: hemerythrin [Desulfobacteraceae bacterium]